MYPPAQNNTAAMNVVFLNAAAASDPFFKKVIEKTPIIDATYPINPSIIGIIT